jgi:hypothetical protein
MPGPGESGEGVVLSFAGSLRKLDPISIRRPF